MTPKRIATNRPKLSVVTTTHDQEGFARDAFDSFVAQQIDFPMEIIVADDASTDATRAIIQEYVDRYPHLFRPILRPKNLGLNRNLVDALSKARGTYIALCEGDDYWIDPLKLSKQVAFLDRHPKTAVCFHPVRTIWEDGRVEDEDFPPVSLARRPKLGCLDQAELHPDQLGRVPPPPALPWHPGRCHASGPLPYGAPCVQRQHRICCRRRWPSTVATRKVCGTTGS